MYRTCWWVIKIEARKVKQWWLTKGVNWTYTWEVLYYRVILSSSYGKVSKRPKNTLFPAQVCLLHALGVLVEQQSEHQNDSAYIRLGLQYSFPDVLLFHELNGFFFDEKIISINFVLRDFLQLVLDIDIGIGNPESQQKERFNDKILASQSAKKLKRRENCTVFLTLFTRVCKLFTHNCIIYIQDLRTFRQDWLILINFVAGSLQRPGKHYLWF